MSKLVCGVLMLFAIMYSTVDAATLCTIVVDAQDGKVLLEEGNCRVRVTPASTFKIPLAVIGFESGILQDAHNPVLPFKEGYVDWGGDNWKQPTDPTRWIKYSVVWYSQIIAHRLGEQTLTDYARKFGFGNADFTGDPGKRNGLDRAWIGSSLQVSPFEQTIFLRALVMRRLPASERAMTAAAALIEAFPAGDGWSLHGKTGAAFPRSAEGVIDEAHGFGWFVGWATKGGRTFVFARLTQDEQKQPSPAGLRARDALVADWRSLVKPRLR